MNELKAELQRLYADSSKHSVYQNVPDFVSAELGYSESIDEVWRGDRPRLAFLSECRTPVKGETWLDFGANTGFFTLSLAHGFPQSTFVAVEANPNHARYIERVANYFEMRNVEVIQRAIGLRDLTALPRSDFMLHLNVLHHAGHDFDSEQVTDLAHFPEYAISYLRKLRERTGAMLFQMGSNWGGDKSRPLVAVHADAKKLATFSTWLRDSGWTLLVVGYAHRRGDGHIRYDRFVDQQGFNDGSESWAFLNQFPGEFYRRPLFFCNQLNPVS